MLVMPGVVFVPDEVVPGVLCLPPVDGDELPDVEFDPESPDRGSLKSPSRMPGSSTSSTRLLSEWSLDGAPDVEDSPDDEVELPDDEVDDVSDDEVVPVVPVSA